MHDVGGAHCDVDDGEAYYDDPDVMSLVVAMTMGLSNEDACRTFSCHVLIHPLPVEQACDDCSGASPEQLLLVCASCFYLGLNLGAVVAELNREL